MYAYVAGLVKDDHVHITIGDGDGYDHMPNNMILSSTGVAPAAIVHEATHALIDATNPDKEVTKGTHEAAAYLAETIYMLLSGGEPYLEMKYLTQPIAELAKKVIAFNASHPSGLFTCPLADTAYIKEVYRSQTGADINRKDKMDGVPFGRGGLIWKMRQESKGF